MTQKTMNDWIGTPAGCAAFWASAKALGFDNDAVHIAFGFESMKEFEGPLNAALDYLKDYKSTLLAAEADEQAANQKTVEATAKDAAKERHTNMMELVSDFVYSSSDVRMPEAANVAWTNVQRPGGPVWSVTVRGVGLPVELADAVDRDTIRRIYNLEKWMRADGYMAVYDSRDIATPILTNKEAWDAAQAKAAPQKTAPPQRAQQASATLPSLPGKPPLAPQTQAPSAPPQQTSTASTPPATQAPTAPQGAAPPVPASVPPQPAQTTGEEQMLQTEFLKVTAPTGTARIEFWRPNRKWAEVSWKFGVADFLSGPGAAMAEAGWIPEHFAIGSEYTIPLNVFWVQSPKDERWKDIVRVTLR